MVPVIVTNIRLLVVCLLLVPWCLILLLLSLDKFADEGSEKSLKNSDRIPNNSLETIDILEYSDRMLEIRHAQTVTSQCISTHRRTAIYIVWIVSTSLYLVMFCLQLPLNTIEVMHLYILQGFFVVLVLVSLANYAFIFLTIRRLKSQPCEEVSLKSIYVPLLMVVTFVCFVMVPNMIVLLDTDMKHSMHDVVYFGAMLLTDCACTIHVLIYMCLNKPKKQGFPALVACQT